MNAILDQKMTVEQVLTAYPELAHVFIQLKLDCVGCQLERFCSLEEVASSYEMPLEVLIEKLSEYSLSSTK